MSTLLAPSNSEFLSHTSSRGSSTEHYKIVQEVQKARIHRLEPIVWKYNASLLNLFSISDISEFEDKVEQIRDELIEGHFVLSKEDVNLLRQVLVKLGIFKLLSIARLLGPLLENERLSQDAASIIINLLKHPKGEVRYAALEAISYALGEVPIAEKTLAQAKGLLQNEESTFVREYLESL